MDSNFSALTNGDVAALVDLYNSMLLMGESGVGYSPKTAEAFKKLHANHPVGIQLPTVTA